MCCFFKQMTAYGMRISDGSSDVCSSDLHLAAVERDELIACAQAAAFARHAFVAAHAEPGDLVVERHLKPIERRRAVALGQPATQSVGDEPARFARDRRTSTSDKIGRAHV